MGNNNQDICIDLTALKRFLQIIEAEWRTYASVDQTIFGPDNDF